MYGIKNSNNFVMNIAFISRHFQLHLLFSSEDPEISSQKSAEMQEICGWWGCQERNEGRRPRCYQENGIKTKRNDKIVGNFNNTTNLFYFFSVFYGPDFFVFRNFIECQ